MNPPKPYTEEVIKKGRQKRGLVRTYLDGRKVFLTHRKQSDVYCSGRSSISDAMRSGVAGWALHEETLMLVKTRAIPYIGVMVTDTGDVYLAHAALWFDRTPGRRWFLQLSTESAWSKELQRVMPLSAFAFRRGSVVMTPGA